MGKGADMGGKVVLKGKGGSWRSKGHTWEETVMGGGTVVWGQGVQGKLTLKSVLSVSFVHFDTNVTDWVSSTFVLDRDIVCCLQACKSNKLVNILQHDVSFACFAQK